MGRRPKTTPAHEIRKRRGKLSAKDAQSPALEPASHQDPETADEAQTAADVAQDGAEAAETALPEPEDGQEAWAEGVEPGDVVRETEAAEGTSGPDDAGTSQADVPAALGSVEPTSQTADTSVALALKRWRERPTCCCGCGQALSSAKKHFIQGHDGRARATIRKIMKGELPASEAPTELILRHSEIKFIMRSPEFHRVVELWRELCGLTHTAAVK